MKRSLIVFLRPDIAPADPMPLAPLPTPTEVLYAGPTDTGEPRSCASCTFFYVRMESCELHEPDLTVRSTEVCGLHVTGAPHDEMRGDERPGMRHVTPEESGLVETVSGAACDKCRWYELVTQYAGRCRALSDPETEEPTVSVEARGCCARFLSAEAVEVPDAPDAP